MADSSRGDARPGTLAGTRRRANRLADELSPYLRLHAHNPVDWYPWGPEALDKARDENKPIFLSVGYATCYWCHVMERESFSDAGTATLMNDHFVNIKVDREERPELDEIYMAATQIMTQQGGWPNSVFLTPTLRPYFAGTYFPPVDQHGRPSFKTVLLSMHHAWNERRDDVEAQAEELAEGMRRMLEDRGQPAESVPSAEVGDRARQSLAARFDARWGGFARAPKFPTPANLLLLLDAAEQAGSAGEEAREGGEPGPAAMLETTLDHMARGGVYDQLAGGFHRYSTDREWRVPHFEKMLYDNGLLLEVYARDYARTGDEERRRIVLETARFLERELTAPEGGLWSAIDAEVGGKEGAHHVWTVEQIAEVLGEEDTGFLAPILGFDGPPTFEKEAWVLHLPRPWSEQSSARRMATHELIEQVRGLADRLLEARRGRPMPLVDDKVLTDWNGMAIAGLALAGANLSEARLVDQARRAAEFLLDHLVDAEGQLLHSWRRADGESAGEARFPAYLSDYVFLVHGLLALYDADGDETWLDHAERLTQQQIERLEDSENGGFYGAAEAEDLLFRAKEVFDGAMPSTNGMAVLNLLALAERRDRERFLPVAERTLRAFASFVERQPEGSRTLCLATERYHRLVAAPSEQEAVAATVQNLVEKAARALVVPTLRIEPAAIGAEESSWRPFELVLEIKAGWHIYAAEESEADPTEAGAVADRNLGDGSRVVDESPIVEPTSLRALDGGELRQVRFPPGDPLGPAAHSPRVLHGTVRIGGEIRGAEAVELRFQPCDDRRCLAPIGVRVEAVEPQPS